jgi:hypothetical protein
VRCSSSWGCEEQSIVAVWDRGEDVGEETEKQRQIDRIRGKNVLLVHEKIWVIVGWATAL